MPAASPDTRRPAYSGYFNALAVPAALTYIADGLEADRNPSLRYITLLREGARAHGLPEQWLRFLDEVKHGQRGAPPAPAGRLTLTLGEPLRLMVRFRQWRKDEDKPSRAAPVERLQAGCPPRTLGRR